MNTSEFEQRHLHSYDKKTQNWYWSLSPEVRQKAIDYVINDEAALFELQSYLEKCMKIDPERTEVILRSGLGGTP
ncbi:MAG: hypothetical protein JKX97_05860 [Candidatus Lindowbacteria bacterium]|nr:hypothetical protein [Candidatus Lindowbacteria bacterium]